MAWKLSIAKPLREAGNKAGNGNRKIIKKMLE